MAESKYDEYLSKNLLKNLLYNFLMEIEKYGVESDRLRGEFFRKIDQSESAEEYMEYCEGGHLRVYGRLCPGLKIIQIQTLLLLRSKITSMNIIIKNLI